MKKGQVKQYDIPFYEKYLLTSKEAAAYFGIGILKMRQLVKDNQNANWIMKIGTHSMIKRELFEKYISTVKQI